MNIFISMGAGVIAAAASGALIIVAEATVMSDGVAAVYGTFGGMVVGIAAFFCALLWPSKEAQDVDSD